MGVVAIISPLRCTVAHHSYQTFPSIVLRHKFTLKLLPSGTRIGSRNGKYKGNHENMPFEKLCGAIEIAHWDSPLEKRTAVNVPSRP